MPLQGGLRELALLDILQVVAFSKKTGHLLVKWPLGQGGVVFRNGLIHCAYSPTTIDFSREIKGPRDSEENQAFILEQIQIALKELISLQDGRFEFKLSESTPTELDGVDLRSIYLTRGVNTQSVLLNLAKEMDDERRDTQHLFESVLDEVPALDSFHPSLEPGSSSRLESSRDEVPTVVLVDDEEMVTNVLAAELSSTGYEVVTATGPSEGSSAARGLIDSGRRVLLITDLRMPTTQGTSFFGGFELVRTLRRHGLRLPIVLMVEKLKPKILSHAKKLGIRQVVFKPALSKLDSDQYGADLQSFATVLKDQIRALMETAPGSADENGRKARINRSAYIIDYLTGMTGRLMQPSHTAEISKIVLQVATKYFERGILFLLKREQACGLGGFGLARTVQGSFELARQLVLDIDRVEPLAEVVHAKRTGRFRDLKPFDECLYQVIGRSSAKECILVPMLNNREVLAVLYGDKGVTGKPLGKLRGLELFMTQASMALENLSLHRKLALFQTRFFSGQEHTARG